MWDDSERKPSGVLRGLTCVGPFQDMRFLVTVRSKLRAAEMYLTLLRTLLPSVVSSQCTRIVMPRYILQRGEDHKDWI